MNSLSIRELATQICPDLAFIIAHNSPLTDSTWLAGLETGKAVEFLSLCALIAIFRSKGQKVLIPELYKTNPDCFYLRNVIPRHHGAQAGHDAAIIDKIPLKDRFIAALTPKALVKGKNGNNFLIFREGHPIHFMNTIMQGKTEYLDRPDIIITEGEIDVAQDILTELPFKYNCQYGHIEGALRIRNDIKVPLISYKGSREFCIPVNGIVECSIGKGKDRAKEQLRKYLELFNCLIKPSSILINGRQTTGSGYDHEVCIDLMSMGVDNLDRQLSAAFSLFVTDIMTKH